MRNLPKGCIVALAGLLLFFSQAKAQTPQPQDSRKAPGGAGYGYGAGSLEEKLKDTGSGGPAPRKDIIGFWAGPASAKLNPVAPMTPWGQQQFSAHKNQSQYPVAESNDPIKTCDPLGFPRNAVYQSRGVAFAQMPGRMLVLSDFSRVWREIWTDGRELPKNVGADSPDAPDPRWYGYSVGHWDGDYTFVVDTVGTNDRTWLDSPGHPHSADLRVQERYTRLDHNTLQLTLTIDDPKAYTNSFVLTDQIFRWIPEQEFDEQICVPSDMLEYLKIIANPLDGK
jgi:hypothetical protein